MLLCGKYMTKLHIQIQPTFFFPKIVVKVAHLLAAELEHLVMEVFVVASDKAVSEFMDAERLETLLGQLHTAGAECDVVSVKIV